MDSGSVLAILVILLLTAIFVTVLFRHQSRNWRQSANPPKHWLTTEGTVSVSRVKEVKDGEGRIDYIPDVQCVYLIDNISYTTTPSCSRSWLVLSWRDAEKAASKYPEGMTVTVRYDPQNPRRAVVEDRRVIPPLWRRVWRFQIDDTSHVVELEHGIISGQLTIHLDGRLLKYDNMLFRTRGEYPFHISSHLCVVLIRSSVINYKHTLTFDGCLVGSFHSSMS